MPCAAELWLAAAFRCQHTHEPMHTHVHALAHVMPRWRCASPTRRCASPVSRRAGRGLASRPDARTRARPNHRWAGRSRPCSSVHKTMSPPCGAPPLSTPAAPSCHPSVVARRRVHLFEAARPRVFTCTHSLASELPRRYGYPRRYAVKLEPHQAVLPAPHKIVPPTRSSPRRPLARTLSDRGQGRSFWSPLCQGVSSRPFLVERIPSVLPRGSLSWPSYRRSPARGRTALPLCGRCLTPRGPVCICATVCTRAHACTPALSQVSRLAGAVNPDVVKLDQLPPTSLCLCSLSPIPTVLSCLARS
jgi:hypothetical protein